MTLRDLQEKRDYEVTAKTVKRVLRKFAGRVPFIAELDGDGPDKLTIGIGPTYGFVQHSAKRGEPPYLAARARGPVEDGIRTYLITSTETEIASAYTLPMDDVIAIATYFLETSRRAPDYDWEAI